MRGDLFSNPKLENLARAKRDWGGLKRKKGANASTLPDAVTRSFSPDDRPSRELRRGPGVVLIPQFKPAFCSIAPMACDFLTISIFLRQSPRCGHRPGWSGTPGACSVRRWPAPETAPSLLGRNHRWGPRRRKSPPPCRMRSPHRHRRCRNITCRPSKVSPGWRRPLSSCCPPGLNRRSKATLAGVELQQRDRVGADQPAVLCSRPETSHSRLARVQRDIERPDRHRDDRDGDRNVEPALPAVMMGVGRFRRFDHRVHPHDLSDLFSDPHCEALGLNLIKPRKIRCSGKVRHPEAQPLDRFASFQIAGRNFLRLGFRNWRLAIDQLLPIVAKKAMAMGPYVPLNAHRGQPWRISSR